MLTDPRCEPVTWTFPPGEEVRISVQPERQTTSSISADSGTGNPPPAVSAKALPAQIRKIAHAEKLKSLVLPVDMFSFVRACGVSCRARAERVALPGNECP